MSERGEFWRELIERQARSGLSVAAFCEQWRVSTASFYAWRKRLREERQATPMFVPVQVESGLLSNPVVEIARTDGTVVRVFAGAQRQIIEDVLAALGAVS